MRKPDTLEYWEKETQFIEREAEKNRPMGSFQTYCAMQEWFAKADGFPELAECIAKAARRGRP